MSDYDRIRPDALAAIATGAKPYSNEARAMALELQEHRAGKFSTQANVVGWIDGRTVFGTLIVEGFLPGAETPKSSPGDGNQWLAVCAQ